MDQSPIISPLSNDPDLCEVVKIFIKYLPNQLQQIADAVNNADLEQLKYLVHSLKGASGSAGYPLLMKKAAQMEQLVNSQQIDSLKTQVDEFSQLCRRINQPTIKNE